MPRLSLLRHGTVEVVVDAPVDAVWAVVGDPTRVGEWSHETCSAEWVDGTVEPRVGARFAGRNRLGLARWTRRSEVIELEPMRRIAWRTVPTRRYRDSTVWSIELSPAAEGTRITQRFEIVLLSAFMERVLALVAKPHRDRRAALADDLLRIGEVAVRQPLRRSGSSAVA